MSRVHAALGAFVDAGGTLVAFNEASDYAIEALTLPVKNVLAGVRSSDFYAPGSLLNVDSIAQSARCAATRRRSRSCGSRAVAGIRHHRSHRVRRRSRAIPPRRRNPLLSGWLLGGAKLAGKAAMVDVKRGKGHVVLFGFRPQYRAQTMATYPLLWNSLRGVTAITP